MVARRIVALMAFMTVCGAMADRLPALAQDAQQRMVQLSNLYHEAKATGQWGVAVEAGERMLALSKEFELASALFSWLSSTRSRWHA